MNAYICVVEYDWVIDGGNICRKYIPTLFITRNFTRKAVTGGYKYDQSEPIQRDNRRSGHVGKKLKQLAAD